MVCKDTLRIKHLPKELTDVQKEDFIRHFGAIKVKVITSKAKAKSILYAKFETEEIAKNILIRLHQILILNSRLCVDYAENDLLQGQLSTTSSSTTHNKLLEEKRDASDKKFLKNFINSINGFNDSVGFYQPPPPHLKYNYPKPNRPTINNIAHALATVPRFYTQVLHLMNKMNLPPPFAMPDPPVRAIPASASIQLGSSQNATKNTKTTGGKRKAASESESELESESDEGKLKEIIPEKRVITQKKPLKRPKFVKHNIQPISTVNKIVEKVENVFEKVDTVQVQKKIELKLVQEVAATTETSLEKNEQKLEEPVEKIEENTPPVISPKVPVEVIIEKSSSVQEIEEKFTEPKEIQPIIAEEEEEPRPISPDDEFPCISLEELRANQITDLTVMPVFKNYTAGDPTNKLYIKNCAKTVVVQDLEYIFNRYREEPSDGNKGKPSEFNIRLMQEGRMKGQAFVTLDSTGQAQKAVQETNGFILKDKPLVVVFGKAGKKK